MLTNDIVLAGNSTTRTYSLVSVVDGNSVRRNSAAPLDQPEALTIRNSESIKGGRSVKRHLIRLDLRKLNSVTQAPVDMAAYTVLEVPTDPAATAVIVKDMVKQLQTLLDSSTIDKILNGEP